MSHTTSILTLKVTRHKPELITPAKHTPNGFKELSDIDDIPLFRVHIPVIQFYRKCEFAQGKHPPKVIKDAIALALVYYYPFAGRLRNTGNNAGSFVDCTAEGVVFVEAEADVSLHEFGDLLYPPFPCVSELFFDPPGSLFGTPLLHFQVTTLKCGGFILGVMFNHIMCDASGIVQFLTAVGELARGLPSPSVHPVWSRHLLKFETPPKLVSKHQESEHEEPKSLLTPILKPRDELVQSGFIFDSAAVTLLRDIVVPHLPKCTTFELITAAVWHAWTMSQNLDPNAMVSIRFSVNARNKYNMPPIPKGYYGNALVSASAITTAGELKSKPFAYTVELIQKAKYKSTEDYQSSKQNMLSSGRPLLQPVHILRVSNVRWAGADEVDYGWGKAVFGGAATIAETLDHGILTFFSQVKMNEYETAVVVPMALHKPAMDIFTRELNILIGNVQKWTPSGIEHRARM